MTDGADPAADEPERGEESEPAHDAERADVPEETDIRPLDEDTVAKIAAGEVVERPASVVKELVENALDADATRVDVAVENGGIDRIEVTDDGVGMTEADLRASVREHTTSKLTDAAELTSVETLGFRGEALHTIGAIARLTITSRPRAGSEGSTAAAATGARIRYDGGDLESVESAAHPEGTTVAVEDLFYNTPARRKYLAEPATEFRHVSKVVGRYALANPDVAVSLEHDGSQVFATTGDRDRQSAVMAVYGREVAESMVAVDAAFEDADTGGDAVDRVVGLVSEPETTRASREYLATYVNDRYVEADVLRSAIVEAYGGQLAADRYPFAVLFVDVPAERVDVNVHPRKLAVRFDDETGVRDAVTDAVRDALLSAGLVRSSAPRGASAPDEVAIEPGTVDESDGARATAPDGAASTAGDAASESTGEETASVAGTEAGSAPEDGSAGDPDAADAASETPSAVDAASGSQPAADAPSPTPTTEPTSDDATSDETGSQSSGERPSAETAASASAETAEPTSSAETAASASSTETADPTTSAEAPESSTGGRSPRDARPGSNRRFDASDQQTLAGDSSTTEIEYDRLPALRVLGQLQDTYLVAEDEDGLVLIDQHAADERIHFERLRDAVEDGTAQVLADPVELSLTPTEAATYDDYADAIERLGFHADREDQTLSVRSVPAVLGETLEPDALRDVFGALLHGDDGARTVEAMADGLLADLACAPAVTGNTSLTEGSLTDLLAALDDCENPFECPHGRPTVVRIDAGELEDRFERDYPGHGVRRD